MPQPNIKPQIYAGIDGCKAGWLVVQGISLEEFSISVAPNLSAIASLTMAIALIDIPVGLPDAEPRPSDQLVRRLLGHPRSSSVFSAPTRPAIEAPDYPSANQAQRAAQGKGLSKQSWNLAPRIRDADAFIREHQLQKLVRESHPELCFAAFNGGSAMQHRKKDAEGKQERLGVLLRFWPEARTAFIEADSRFPRGQVQPDDILDAMVLFLAATELVARLVSYPDPPPVDEKGLPMHILAPDPRFDKPRPSV